MVTLYLAHYFPPYHICERRSTKVDRLLQFLGYKMKKGGNTSSTHHFSPFIMKKRTELIFRPLFLISVKKRELHLFR